MADGFWTRTKVGTASGVAGLLLGAALGVAGQPSVDAANPDVKALVSAGVEKKTSVLDDQADALREQLGKAQADATEAAAAAADAEQQLAEAKATAKAAKAAARAAKAEAKKAKAEAAKQAAAARHPAASKPAPTYGLTGSGGSGGSSGSAGGGSDPLFGTCGEANAHGYGNYHSGQDPEYGNYQDRDHDGVVCEF